MHCQLIEKTLMCALVTKSQNRHISACNVYSVLYIKQDEIHENELREMCTLLHYQAIVITLSGKRYYYIIRHQVYYINR